MIIRDPKLITKFNPTGQRAATQADIDHLQRVSAAYSHLVPYLTALLPTLVGDARNIIAGLSIDPPMTDEELRAYMASEDASMPESWSGLADVNALGMTFLDHEGNLIK